MTSEAAQRKSGSAVRLPDSPMTEVPYDVRDTFPLQSIGFIDTNYEPTVHLQEFGTGYVLDDRHVLTAAHAIFNVTYGTPAYDRISFTLPNLETFNPVDIFKAEELNTLPDIPIFLDFAVMRFAANSFNVTPIPLAVLSRPQLQTIQVLIAGWIGSTNREYMQAGPALLQSGDTTFEYPISTLPAQSGAPVLYQSPNGWVSVGVHSRGGSVESGVNYGVRMTSFVKNQIEAWMES